MLRAPRPDIDSKEPFPRVTLGPGEQRKPDNGAPVPDPVYFEGPRQCP